MKDGIDLEQAAMEIGRLLDEMHATQHEAAIAKANAALARAQAASHRRRRLALERQLERAQRTR